jgi:hypothetical protein
MRWLIAAALVACACPSKQAGTGTTTTGGGGSGIGSSGGGQVELTGCEAARSKVEALYRADAQQHEPKRVDEAVADNTAMVMAECNRLPDAFTTCISSVTSVKDLETLCMPKLDEEGSEADALAR